MKKTVRENYLVQVEPTRSLYSKQKLREEEDQKTCESIIEEIKRHVNDVWSLEVIYDERETCSFCGREWEVWEGDKDDDFTLDIGEPVCCKEASDEFHKQKEESDEN